MCAAAHGWVGLGRIAYAVSAARLAAWQSAWGAPAAPVRPPTVIEVVPGLVVDGLEELLPLLHDLHRHRYLRGDPGTPAGWRPAARLGPAHGSARAPASGAADGTLFGAGPRADVVVAAGHPASTDYPATARGDVGTAG